MPAARETRPRCDVRPVLWKTIPQAETEKPYVWFVREDGSNLSEVVDDARAVLLTTGMAWINEFSDLARILSFAENEPEEWDAQGTTITGTWVSADLVAHRASISSPTSERLYERRPARVVIRERWRSDRLRLPAGFQQD
jgi:precorrin-6x reductase